MIRPLVQTILMLGLLLACPSADAAEPANEDLARQAHDLLKRYCYRCHGSRFEVPGFNVLDRDLLVAVPPTAKRRKSPYVIPGKPDESLLWKRLAIEEDMPPEDPTPTETEKATLKQWITAGAPFPIASPPRPFKTEADLLTSIRDDLRGMPPEDRPFRRYFTLAHLHNNRKVLDGDLRLYRAAVAKLANSLSSKARIAEIRAVDKEQTILSVDLRDLGWDQADLWREVLKLYPFGLGHGPDLDRPLSELSLDVSRLSGSDLAYLRADWFVATASRPPLYHTMLRLPDDAGELERRLDVDVRGDFLRNRLARAGFATSGVSSQNRLVDRHASAHGAYWKSYDFKSNEGAGNLFQFPLGPAFDTNPFARQAFAHDGGEIVFNLPNGLQGYLLVDGKDIRINAGPIEVVGDSLRTSGTAAIVNGLSCMACHRHGVISEFKDTIREGSAVAGEAREKVNQLFPKPEAMDRLLREDEERFVKALEQAAGTFLKVGEDQNKPIRDFPEPIRAIARLYIKDLGADEVAYELGLADSKSLVGAIKTNPRLRQLGIGPLMNGATIKRSMWESLETFISPFQNAARELEMGTPLRIH